MASNNELTITIKASSSAAEQALARVVQKVKDLGDKAANEGSQGLSKLQAVAVAVGNVIANVVSKAFQKLAAQVDTAIKRVDTFNQYPKVLEQFGVAADEARASVSRIDKAVRGLPTSLDRAISGVQSLFVVTQDLKLSEKLFTAVNDAAMIFAQGSTEAVSRFQYAYSQALAAGKVDAANFRQMNEAIPGVMAKVAASMGLTMNEMKNGLSDGSISVDKFNDALIKLDTEGGAGMEAMANTARTATGGIATSMTNASTAIARGIAGVIEAIGTNNIANYFTNAGAKAEAALGKVADFIDFLKSHAEEVKIFTAAVAGLGAALTAMAAPSIAANISSTLKTISGSFSGMLKVFTGNPIVAVIVGIVAALALFLTKTEAGQKILQKLGEIMSGVFEKIGPVIEQVMGTLSDVFSELATSAAPVIEGIVQVVGEMAQAFLPLIKQIFPQLMPMIRSFANLFLTIGKSVIQIVLALVEAFKPLIPVIVNLVTTVAQLVMQLVSALMPIIQLIIGLIMQLIPVLMPIITFIINMVATIISAIMPILTVIIQIIAKILEIIINVVVVIINIVMGIITTIVNIITGIINVVTSIVTTIINIIAGVISTIAGIINSIIDTVRNVLSSVFGFFKSIFTNIANFVGGIVEKIVGFFKGIGKTIGEFIGSAFKGVINGALALAEGFLNAPIKLINGAIDIINKIPGVNIGKITEIKLPRMEEGGILGGTSYSGDKQAYMGNAGEMVINRRDQSALWNAIKSGNLGNTNNSSSVGDINITVNVSNDGTDWTEEQSRSMAQSILRQLRSQGLSEFNQVGALR